MARWQDILKLCGARCVAVAALMLCLALPGASLPAHGADLQRKPSQLSVRHWTREDGLPAEFVWSVHQSASGFLWLATDTGLARFDGHKFEQFGSATHDVFRSNDIREIAEGADGTIWAASVGGGLLRVRGKEIDRFDRNDGLASDALYSVLVAANGDVWVGTASGACRRRDGAFRCWTQSDGLVGGRIVRLAEDPQNRIWFASVTDGVSVLVDEQVRSFDASSGYSDAGATVLLADPSRNMLVGTLAGIYFQADPEGMVPLNDVSLSSELKPFNAIRDRAGNVIISTLGGIWQIEPTTRRLDNPDNDIGYVTDLFEDRDGQLWAASSTGLYQYSAGLFTPYGHLEGVANQTFAVSSAGDNSVWTGTEASGVFHVYPDGRVQRFTTDDGLPINAVSTVLAEPDGTVWLGTFGRGLAVMRDEKIVRLIGTKDGLAGGQVGSLYRDGAGNLWVGTNGGLNRLSGYEVTATLTVADGLLHNMARDVRQDRAGRLLISGDNGLTIVAPDTLEVLDALDGSKGLSNYNIATTHVDERGVIWIGARSGGLLRMADDQLFEYNAAHNVRQTSVMAIAEDQQGHLWLGGRDGIVRIPRAELDAVARGARDSVSSRTFSSKDGLRATRVSGGYQSAATLAGDGRLWFATTGGLAVIEPDKLDDQPAPLPVSIEAVRADGESIDVSEGGDYRIPAGTQSVQIDYAVPSINAADTLRFHYRLGDAPWQDASERRTAFFTSLPPRNHTFGVAVRYEGQPFGVGPMQQTSIKLFVEPLFYQTHLARALALSLFCLLLWSGYRFALRVYRRRQRHLEKLVDERTAALREALSEVRAMSRIDTLTGVANRRCLEERIEEAWAAAVRHGHPVTIMMIDIDHFKKYNDSAGHQAGDHCLTAVAKSLQQSVRTEDFVARYGGEEFAVLLMGSDVNDMCTVAGRLRKNVRELGLDHPGLAPGSVVTISAGFATSEPKAGDQAEDLIRRADEALYRAKNNGRDRVEFAEPEPTGADAVRAAQGR